MQLKAKRLFLFDYFGSGKKEKKIVLVKPLEVQWIHVCLLPLSLTRRKRPSISFPEVHRTYLHRKCILRLPFSEGFNENQSHMWDTTRRREANLKELGIAVFSDVLQVLLHLCFFVFDIAVHVATGDYEICQHLVGKCHLPKNI